MPSKVPFIDPATRDLDTGQILSEAVPLVKLIGLFVAISFLPIGLGFFALGNSVVGALFAVIGQLILAVGAGIVLIYIIARGIQLSGE
jgi:hypothetical protein